MSFESHFSNMFVFTFPISIGFYFRKSALDLIAQNVRKYTRFGKIPCLLRYPPSASFSEYEHEERKQVGIVTPYKLQIKFIKPAAALAYSISLLKGKKNLLHCSELLWYQRSFPCAMLQIEEHGPSCLLVRILMNLLRKYISN